MTDILQAYKNQISALQSQLRQAKTVGAWAANPQTVALLNRGNAEVLRVARLLGNLAKALEGTEDHVLDNALMEARCYLAINFPVVPK